MLSNTLVTNEVKDAAGAKVDFTRISISDRKTEFAQIGEVPSSPNHLTISHQETGSGLNTKRRSVVRFDLTGQGQVDTTTTRKAEAYLVLVNPIGNSSSNALVSKALAQLMSFVASTGADSTIKFDGTGNGAAALLGGSL